MNSAAKAASLVAATILLNTNSRAVEDYALPRTKANIGACRKAATALHSGRMEEFSFHHRSDETQYFRIVIIEKDGSRWIMLCEAATGKIFEAWRDETQ